LNRAVPGQKFQDWFTQQWVILGGKKIDPTEYAWLMGPYGNLNGIGKEFIDQLTVEENLVVDKSSMARGLIHSFDMLKLPINDRTRLDPEIIHFYENTTLFDLSFSVRWNPFFKLFGILVNKLFSSRIRQLNIPTLNFKTNEELTSDIITLTDPQTKLVKHTFWLRTIKTSGQIIYSGIYGTCTLPSGKTGIKAVFPLPKGNATVIMIPEVNKRGELILDASGKKFGDAGFYFLLMDAKGNHWSRYLSSFHDNLMVSVNKNQLSARQILKLWNRRVLRFDYKMSLKQPPQ
jgi:hypothetical protein